MLNEREINSRSYWYRSLDVLFWAKSVHSDSLWKPYFVQQFAANELRSPDSNFR